MFPDFNENCYSVFQDVCSFVELEEEVEVFKNTIVCTIDDIEAFLDFTEWTINESHWIYEEWEKRCIVPLLKFFLSNPDSELKKAAYKILLNFCLSNKISKEYLEKDFCGLLAKLINESNDDEMIVAALNRINSFVYFINEQIIAEEILPEIIKFCSNQYNPQFKTLCIFRLDRIALRIGQAQTEKLIIPLYQKLVNEDVMLRKVCVELSIGLSYICSEKVRNEIILPIYLSFLNDTSDNHISDIAYVALGSFIASYAKNGNSYLNQSLEEIINMVEYCRNSLKLFEMEKIYEENKQLQTYFCTKLVFNNENDNVEERSFKKELYDQNLNKINLSIDQSSNDNFKNDLNFLFKNDINLNEDISDTDEIKEEFNSFNYWREPILNFGDLDLDDEKIPENSDNSDKDFIKFCFEQHKQNLDNQVCDTFDFLKDNQIPKELLSFFVKALFSRIGNGIYSTEIQCGCVHSLPAVSLALGKENWPWLRKVFNSIVISLSPKMKSVLIASLYELSKIIGPAYTSQDISAAFFFFMKDSDQIREQVLDHLATIVPILDKSKQNDFLKSLPNFLDLINKHNWRFKVKFIKEFNLLIHLFTDIHQFSQIIIPITFYLLNDKVSAVRIKTIILLGTVIKSLFVNDKFDCPKSAEVKENLLNQIKDEFYSSKKWKNRQLFISICEDFLIDSNLPINIFKSKFLMPLLSLKNDSVANVRLSLSRFVHNDVIKELLNEPFLISETIGILAADKDKDVRSFLNEVEEEENEIKTTTIPIARDELMDEILNNAVKNMPLLDLEKFVNLI